MLVTFLISVSIFYSLIAIGNLYQLAIIIGVINGCVTITFLNTLPINLRVYKLWSLSNNAIASFYDSWNFVLLSKY